MRAKNIVLLFALAPIFTCACVFVVALAQNIPFSAKDLQAALGECNTATTIAQSRAQQLAVQLARANEQIQKLEADAKKAEPKP